MPYDQLVKELTRIADEQSAKPGHSLRHHEDHIKEDLELFSAGILDLGSLMAGYHRNDNNVEVAVRDANGKLKQLRRQKNTNVDQGRNLLQRTEMFSDVAASAAFATITGAATATSATSLTRSTAAFPTSGGASGSLQGHVVWAVNGSTGLVYGVIMSNTATVLTVDQWYDPTSTTGAAGTTPGATALYCIEAGMGPMNWIALSTDSTTPAAADVLRSADGLFGTGTSGSTASEQTGSGLARAFVLPTFPATHQTQMQNTWTYTGAVSVTINKVVLCNSKAAAGGLMGFDTLLSAGATVAASGDSIQVTWTINN